jgi:hypothetical protein
MPMDVFEQAKQLTDRAMETAQGLKTELEAAAKAAQQTTEQMAASGQELVQAVQLTVQADTQRHLEAIGKTLEDWQVAIASSAAAGVSLTQALQDLPRTAQALAEEMPKVARRLRTGAGVRVGEAARSDADVMALFDKIPGPSKLGAEERSVRIFLSDKHGSHIYPRSKGGGNGASNIVWELGQDNLRRGADVMTGGEQIYIRCYNAVDSLLKNSKTVASLGLAATGTAVLTQSVVTALAYTLDLYRGDITVEEFQQKILEAALSAGIATPIFFLIFVAVMALFPEVVVILSAPAVVAGFNALFGISIALPIVQSLLRHAAAGGFGTEAKAYYDAALSQGDAGLSAVSAT